MTTATALRLAAGWQQSSQGWHSFDGTPIDDWLAEGLPLPEAPGYGAFIDTYLHYERLDSTN